MTVELNPHGPHSITYTRNVAATASEAVRVLNHATRTDDGLDTPADAYDILACLEDVARGMPQTLRQLASWLDTENTLGRLGHDTDDSATKAVAETVAQLAAASKESDALGARIAAARAPLGRVHGRPGD